jgi:hypothetical protein
MVSSCPNGLLTGTLNAKGLGTRPLIATLGGTQHPAAELLLFSADARSERGLIAWFGPAVDEMWKRCQNDEQAPDGIGRSCAEVVKRNGSFVLEHDTGPQFSWARDVTFESEHSYQCGQNRRATNDRLLSAFQRCLNHARKSPAEQCTQFVYYNMGTTKDGMKFLDNQDGRLMCNNDKPLSVEAERGQEGARHLATYIREAYVLCRMGMYPLAGIDNDDHYRGCLKLTVGAEDVFGKDGTNSFLFSEWAKSAPRSELVHIHVGGVQLPMLAFWVQSDTVKTRREMFDQYMDGTFLAYRMNIINPFDGRHLNQNYAGKDAFSHQRMNASRTAATRMNTNVLRNWLGVETGQTWAQVGLPELSNLQVDKARFWELSTYGVMFLVRVEQAVALDLRKDRMISRDDVGASVDEVVYAIRRAQVRWCFDNEPPERLQQAAAAARQAAAAPAARQVAAFPAARRPASQPRAEAPAAPTATSPVARGLSKKRDRKPSVKHTYDREREPTKPAKRCKASKPSASASHAMPVAQEDDAFGRQMKRMNEQFRRLADREISIHEPRKAWQATWSEWQACRPK